MPPATSDSDLESVISLQDRPRIVRRSSTGPKYFCSIGNCGRSFKRLDQLDRHEYHHTGIKKHACYYDDCDKVYSIVTHLKRHLRTTHERQTPPQKTVPCMVEECEKMFQSMSNMQRHVREVHENPKVYSCTHCGEKFTQKLKMRRHEINKHTGAYPYKCDKCRKGFYQQWQHDRHVANCKVYPCANCEQQFDKWSLYLKHCKETQHGRKYYKCEHCERLYAKPSELQKHVAAKHLDDVMHMSYKCTHDGCNRAYAYERNLRQHVRVAHAGQRFVCDVEACAREFSSAQNLTKHLQREHKQLKRKQQAEVGAESKKESEKQTKGQRKKRKDAGKPLISNLAKLTGVAVDKEFDKLLRQREGSALEMVSNMLTVEQMETEAIEVENPADSVNKVNKQKHNETATIQLSSKVATSLINTDGNNVLELDALVAAALADI